MAGETTSFFANSIFSGLNKGLQGRRALKEEERLKALKLQQAAEDRANKIADYQQEQEIAQNIKNRALADDREQMINTAALLGRETKNPGLAYYGIAKAFGLEGGLNPTEKDGANARSSRGASSIPKAIKSDDRQKKLQNLKALRDYMNSVSERRDEFGNIIPAQLSHADLYELGLFEQRLAGELYGEPGDEQSAQGSPNGTSTLSDAFAILFGTAGKPAKPANPAKNNAVSNPLTVDAPVATTEELDVTPSYTVTMLPVTEPTLYEDLARAGEIGTRALSDTIRQGRRDLGDYYDKASAPTTPEEYSRLSALQKLIYKLTGKNIRPRRLEDLIRLNKER